MWFGVTVVSSADDKSRAALVFEVDPVQRVLAARLDAADAQSTVNRRFRQIASIELHDDRVLMRWLPRHRAEPGFSVPPITEAGVPDEPLSA